jgi:hypothetical protein
MPRGWKHTFRNNKTLSLWNNCSPKTLYFLFLLSSFYGTMKIITSLQMLVISFAIAISTVLVITDRYCRFALAVITFVTIPWCSLSPLHQKLCSLTSEFPTRTILYSVEFVKMLFRPSCNLIIGSLSIFYYTNGNVPRFRLFNEVMPIADVTYR